MHIILSQRAVHSTNFLKVVRILHKIFLKPHRMNHIHIEDLASILGGLQRYHQEFVCNVIDDLIESMTLGLEVNEFKFNQKRIAEATYLGYLYVFKAVESSVIFEMMYKIAILGHGKT